ncbi:MAG: phosphotransferase [Phycisphaerae bacterium]|nr:MAG: phosphotransferase [Phycisphaerae bacterium]MBE7457256.1 phosphotransferase [Planctomycetia bacterium]MCK6465472.1 lipopolysaccharide kinase InaA family protein [Phycisphaerae bacterium]MCL4719135.1 phosphotransferase [Phycisphaerae bacterium]NUQ09196.1 phosphotransferase [Phycisphaerae bacterium]
MTQTAARWLIADDAAFDPDEPGAPDWFHLDTEARAEIVKTSAQRAVYRTAWDGREVFIKAWRLGGGSAAVRRWLRLAPGRVEFRRTCAAWRAGAPAVQPLAWGESRTSPCVFVLITESAEPAEALRAAWEHIRAAPLGSVTGERELISAVAAAVAQMHAAGVVHRDLHPRNLLVARGEDGAWRVHILDWRSAKIRSNAPNPACTADLVQLDQHFHRVASRTQRVRFLREYLRARDPDADPRARRLRLRKLITDAAPLVARHRQRLARIRDRRLDGDGRYFAVLDAGGGWRGRVMLRDGRRHVLTHRLDAELTTADWAPVLARAVSRTVDGDNPEPVFAAPWGGLLRCRVSGRLSLADRLRWTLAGSPARSAFLRCHRDRHRDVDVPLILAFAEHRSGAGVIDRFLVIEAIDDPNAGR